MTLPAPPVFFTPLDTAAAPCARALRAPDPRARLCRPLEPLPPHPPDAHPLLPTSPSPLCLAGTTLRYRPGVLLGGADVDHDCGLTRPIGWFVEPLLVLGLFGRKPLTVTLRGVTDGGRDPGIDLLRTCTLPLLRKMTGLTVGDGELKLLSRGLPPRGGGAVRLSLPALKELPPARFLDEGMVKRVRGVAFSARVPPQTAARVVDGARGVLNPLLADVYVFTDHASGPAAGDSPGYGVELVAETTAGCLLSAEACSAEAAVVDGSGGELNRAWRGGREGPRGAAARADRADLDASDDEGATPAAPADEATPEDLGRLAASRLLDEVSRGGAIDAAHQPLALLLCALGPREISEVRVGALTRPAIATLRAVRDVLGITFALKPERDSKTIFASCIGAGIKSLARKIA